MKKSNSVLSGLQTCTSNVTDWVIRNKFIVAPAALILLAAGLIFNFIGGCMVHV